MTKDTLKLQKFLVPVYGHMYVKSYVESEKEKRMFSIYSTLGPFTDSANPIIEVKYKSVPGREFPKYNMADQVFDKIHAHNSDNVYEFDVNNYNIEFPLPTNGGTSNIQTAYNNMVVNILYKKRSLVNDYTPKDMRKMVKSKIEISIEKKK
ncbi:MAG: hypothetical protein HY833_03055 [Candidatus Aenigmarchaeota archaeon]|nr:hypothetical protein [Candidatus Aenigmarchaeota archaeon]